MHDFIRIAVDVRKSHEAAVVVTRIHHRIDVIEVGKGSLEKLPDTEIVCVHRDISEEVGREHGAGLRACLH